MGKKLLILCFIATTFIFLAGCKSKTDFIGQKVSEASYVPDYNFRLLNVNDIQSVCYGEGLGFVAVGKNGGILFSENGQNWEPVGISDDDLNSVCATVNGFVAVGDNGYILHSKDGINWERKSEKTIRFNLLSVAGTDSGYVAAGEFGSIYYSKDGQTWEKKAGELLKFAVSLNNVFADKQGFIISGNQGMIMFSKNGIDWQIAQTNSLTRSIRSSYSNSKGHFVIGENRDLFSCTLADTNLNLNPVNLSNPSLLSISGNDSCFIGVGSMGTILYSSDGKEWIECNYQERNIGIVFTKVIHTKTGFVALGTNIEPSTSTTRYVFHSNDGVQWNNVWSGRGYDHIAFICGGSKGYASLGRFGEFLFSADGKSGWEKDNLSLNDPAINSLSSIAGNSKGFVVVGTSGNILYSKDKFRWELNSTPYEMGLRSVCAVKNGFMAVGDSCASFYSSDGKIWEKTTIEDSNISGIRLLKVISYEDKVMAVGEDGLILSMNSTEKKWTREISPTKETLLSICGNSNGFAAIGHSTVIFSENGQIWQTISLDKEDMGAFKQVWATESGFNVVDYKGNLFMIDISKKKLIPLKRLNEDLSHSAITTSGDKYASLATSGSGTEYLSLSLNGEQWNVVKKVSDEIDLLDISSDGNSIIYIGSGGQIYELIKTNYYFPVPESIKIMPSQKESLSVDIDFKQKGSPLKINWDDFSFKLLGISKTRFNNGKNERLINFNCRFIRPDSVKHPYQWKSFLKYKEYMDIEPGTNSSDFFLQLQITKNDQTQVVNLKGKRGVPYFTLGKTPFQLFWVKYGKWIVLIVAYYLLFLLLWLIFPLMILRLHEGLPLKEFRNTLPAPFNIILGFPNIIFPVSLFANSNRCLDAWVKNNISVLKKQYLQAETVRSKNGYVPLPVRLINKTTGELIEKPSPLLLQRILNKKKAITQVTGPGGSGKTSFACEAGRWMLEEENLVYTGGVRRIPFLLEEETTDLVKLISEYYTAWLDKTVKPELITALLRKQRIVVLADALSEMRTEVIQYMENIHGDTPVNALIVSGRNEFDFRNQQSLLIYPQPLDSKNLLHFITTVLQSYEDHPFLKMEDQLAFAQKIAQIFKSGDKDLPVTPILVRIVITNLIENYSTGIKDTGELIDKIPATIPQVYFDYLKLVNPGNTSLKNYLSEENMLRIVTLMGKLSLGESFVPHDFSLEDARNEIRKILPDLTVDPVQRLIDNNILTKKAMLDSFFLRFNLDPLAEYAGATWYARECVNKEGQQVFIEKIISQLDENAKGFKLAFWLITNPGSQYDKVFGWSD